MSFFPSAPSVVPSAAHVLIARPSRDLLVAERFWTEGLGLDVLCRVAPTSEGEQALLMVGRPRATWHLELVEDQQVGPRPTEEDLLVLSLDGPVPDALVRQLCEAGGRPVGSRNPYWGVTIEDPDGYRLVLCRRGWTSQ